MAYQVEEPAAKLASSYTVAPLQRIGDSSEITRASLFLASEDASYINGAELAVDGGWTVGHYHTMMPGAPETVGITPEPNDI